MIEQASARTSAERLTLLSAMLFLQHAVLGAWAPLYQLHLRDLNFSGAQIGAIYATLAIASIFAPWIGGQLADRVMSARRVMIICHACGAALLWLASRSNQYEEILPLMALNAFVYMPTMALSNTIVFRNLADRDREFGIVRLWGTASWIVAALAMGLWLSRPGWIPGAANADAGDCLRFAAILSALLAVFSLALPPTPPERGPRPAVLGALRLLRDRSTAVLLAVSFFLAVGIPFIYPLGGLFLRSLGVSDAAVSPWMSIGQIGEIAAFLLLAWAVRRWGFKTVFLIGIASWAVRFGVWSAGGPWPLIVLSLSLNGCCYAFVFGLGQMFVDQQSDPDTRASVQSLHQVVTFGAGMWLGNVLAGASLDFFQRAAPGLASTPDFASIFFWPALGAGLCFVVFALFFRTPTPTVNPPAAPTDQPL